MQNLLKRVLKLTQKLMPALKRLVKSLRRMKLTQKTAQIVKKRIADIDNNGNSKMTNPLHSVGLKLFLIFFVSSIIFVMGIGIYSYTQSKSIIKTQSADANYQTIVQASEKLDLILKKYEELTMQLLVNKDLQTALSTISSVNGTDYERFAANSKASDILGSVALTDSSLASVSLLPLQSSESIISTNAGGVKIENLQKEQWFIDADKADGKAVYVPTNPSGVLTKTSNEMTFGVAREFRDTISNKSSYILLIELRVSAISKYLQMNLGDNSELLLMDNSGLIIYSAEDNQIGTTSVFTLPKLPEDETGGSSTLKNGLNEDVLASYNQLASSGWMLLSIVPVHTLVEKASAIFNVTIIGAIIVTIIAALVGIFVIYLVGRPLNKLRDLMDQGAKGNLAVRTNSTAKDEIGQLSRGFNDMMDNITLLVQQTNQSATDVLNTAAELSDASKKTAISAREIAVATEEIANGASNLAVEAESGNGLAIAIGENTEKVIQANQQMSEFAADVEQVSEQGIEHMGVLTEKNTLTEEMVRSLVQKVDALKESTNSIRQILDVLSNMTRQTNILSLNATIEAARAGAAGRGFMVVADEIRKLADQSRQSIGVVGEITDKISGEIAETVEVLSTAYPIFQEQIQSVREVNEIFWAVQGQMGGFIQQLEMTSDRVHQLDAAQTKLAEAMGNVSAVAEEASATSEEVASLSNEQLTVSTNLIDLSTQLEQVSARLKETLTRFTL